MGIPALSANHRAALMDPRAEDAPWSGSVTLEMLKALSLGAKDKANAPEVWIELLETVLAVPSLSKKVDTDNKSGGAVARRRQSRDINAKKRRLAYFERSPSQLREVSIFQTLVNYIMGVISVIRGVQRNKN